ncbi:MAG: CoA pyrophosphatase [Kofleriaceae bacterium]
MSSWIDRITARFPVGDLKVPGTGRFAAVALVLHDDPIGPRVLLMKRAEREGDPWSGHISLPGGRYHATDPHLLATAIRETREELGVELENARLIGQLPTAHPRSSGPNGMEVTPFIFVTDEEVGTTPGPEAFSAFWLPLDLARSGTLDITYRYAPSGDSFPGWSYEGHVIWGLTWRVLQDLIERIG